MYRIELQVSRGAAALCRKSPEFLKGRPQNYFPNTANCNVLERRVHLAILPSRDQRCWTPTSVLRIAHKLLLQLDLTGSLDSRRRLHPASLALCKGLFGPSAKLQPSPS